MSALLTPAARFRFSRPIEAPAGWCRVQIPEDIFNACKPGLPDLRIFDAEGREIPYAVEPIPAAAGRRLALFDTESVPHRETTALVDRGERPGLSDAATFEIPGDEFLKPIVISSSSDRMNWRQMAYGSVFATPAARMTTIHFAPNDRRFWKLALDDRNGDPVTPRSVTIASYDRGRPPARAAPLEAHKLESEDPQVSLYAIVLPAARLPIASLRLTPSDAAFVRQARVYERVLFRGEISRRLVGEGTILRSPGQTEENLIAMGSLLGRNLELEIDNGGSPPLTLARCEMLIEEKSLLFNAPPGAALSLAYGSPNVPAAVYDLASATTHGSPRNASQARLGEAHDSGTVALVLPRSPRGSRLDPALWATHRGIVLPRATSLAYLNLEGAVVPSDLRIIDSARQQVPYIVENGAPRERRKARLTNSTVGTKTVAEIGPFDPTRSIETLEISADSPSFFSRDVVVQEERRDARGTWGNRLLGSAHWERLPNDKPRPLAIPIIAPEQYRLRVEIENADNAPLVLSSASLIVRRRRIDFLFTPGESLTLLTGNREAGPPKYDLAMATDLLLGLPAEPASLAPPAPPRPARLPAWFWTAVTVAGIFLALVLSRTIRRPA
jgi:hypothetical protein